ncbi:MAG TPA: TraR/DksA family transcriptional regulator [Thermomicrobiales bacterium]|jgi:DnaK suppressor protein|nr:TraR/DksA family transcriptional regulator [Thermomicrobiales bacterium]HRA32201.1 TraR/DksA family transcriptional regulator [Thermomicrobiales bacterium]
MMTMNANQRRAWSDRLNAELRETLESLQRIEQEIPALSRDEDEEGGVPANHLADEASNVYELERLATIRAGLTDREYSIRDAQTRLANGVYGICQRCGKQIDPGRLEALPWALYCIECQEIVDREVD